MVSRGLARDMGGTEYSLDAEMKKGEEAKRVTVAKTTPKKGAKLK